MGNEGIIKKRQYPWDYDHNLDTSKSYEAFCVYRDLGVDRTYAKVGAEVNRTIKVIANWSKSANWQGRALAYDLDQEKIRRDFIEKQKIVEHKNKLFKYLTFCENLGWANLELAADCLDVSKKALTQYKEDPSIVLKPFEVKALASAGVSSAEIGHKLLSEALAINKLLEMLPVDVDAEEIEG